MHWFKLPGKARTTYAAGFTNLINAEGSRYQKPGRDIRVLNFANEPDNGKLTLDQGNLVQTPDVREFTLGINNRITTSDKFAHTLQLGTGLFKGSFTEPGTKKPRSMSGALLQEKTLGGGLFLDGGETGSVLIEKNP